MTQNRNKIINYIKHISTKFDNPTVIFHHGFMSDMQGHKALSIESYCKKHDLNYIRYDNYGCGSSSGEITDQNLTSWLEGAKSVVEMVDPQSAIIHIGSSLGGWIATLLAQQSTHKILGVITLAPAFDFTQRLIMDKLDDAARQKLQHERIIYINPQYPITLNMIEDSQRYLLLANSSVELSCPIHIIHGMEDLEVPYEISVEFMQKISSPQAILKLVHDGSHRLSRDQDLALIYSSIQEMLLL